MDVKAKIAIVERPEEMADVELIAAYVQIRYELESRLAAVNMFTNDLQHESMADWSRGWPATMQTLNADIGAARRVLLATALANRIGDAMQESIQQLVAQYASKDTAEGVLPETDKLIFPYADGYWHYKTKQPLDYREDCESLDDKPF